MIFVIIFLPLLRAGGLFHTLASVSSQLLFTSDLSLCLFLQAVETNLASKDSHWVYANEVRPGSNQHRRLRHLTFSLLLLCFHVLSSVW